jgi:hypothetical protein
MAYVVVGALLAIALVLSSVGEDGKATLLFVLAGLVVAGKIGYDTGYQHGREDALDPTGEKRAALRKAQEEEGISRLMQWNKERQEAKRAREAAKRREP